MASLMMLMNILYMYVSVSKFRLSVAYRSNCILFSESRDPCVLCLIAGIKEARAEEWFEKLKRFNGSSSNKSSRMEGQES